MTDMRTAHLDRTRLVAGMHERTDDCALCYVQFSLLLRLNFSYITEAVQNLAREVARAHKAQMPQVMSRPCNHDCVLLLGGARVGVAVRKPKLWFLVGD